MGLHWLDAHSTDMTPPTFKFETIGRYKDPFSRQTAEALYIIREGTLNSKT